MTPAEQVVKARVLLMVERDGRVVCVRRWNAEPDLSSFHWAVYLEGRTHWLVEAESADGAREAIKRSGFMDYSHGRVLASGGKS